MFWDQIIRSLKYSVTMFWEQIFIQAVQEAIKDGVRKLLSPCFTKILNCCGNFLKKILSSPFRLCYFVYNLLHTRQNLLILIFAILLGLLINGLVCPNHEQASSQLHHHLPMKQSSSEKTINTFKVNNQTNTKTVSDQPKSLYAQMEMLTERKHYFEMNYPLHNLSDTGIKKVVHHAAKEIEKFSSINHCNVSLKFEQKHLAVIGKNLNASTIAKMNELDQEIAAKGIDEAAKELKNFYHSSIKVTDGWSRSQRNSYSKPDDDNGMGRQVSHDSRDDSDSRMQLDNWRIDLLFNIKTTCHCWKSSRLTYFTFSGKTDCSSFGSKIDMICWEHLQSYLSTFLGETDFFPFSKKPVLEWEPILGWEPSPSYQSTFSKSFNFFPCSIEKTGMVWEGGLHSSLLNQSVVPAKIDFLRRYSSEKTCMECELSPLYLQSTYSVENNLFFMRRKTAESTASTKENDFLFFTMASCTKYLEISKPKFFSSENDIFSVSRKTICRLMTSLYRIT